MKRKNTKSPNSREKLVYVYLFLLIGLLLFIFFGLPDAILYAKRGILRWLPFILIFFLSTFLIFKMLIGFKVNSLWSKGIAYVSPLILGPTFGLWSTHISNLELEKHGEITIGLVSEKWESKKSWKFNADFEVRGKKYQTFTQTDFDNIYQIGSPVKILFSVKNPENNTVIE